MTPRTSTPSNTASPAPATPTPNPPYVGNIEKRHFKIDNVNINIHSDVQRNNCIGLLYNGLAFMGRDSVDFVAAKATEAEGAAFKTYKGNTPEYRAKIRSLFQNLKVRSNSELRRRVLTGVIDATEFVKMSQEELKSQEHKERDRAYERENINNAQVAQPEKSISDALTCGKCGQKKVSYTQAQTRSADEPMTTFCECLHCGNRWKVCYFCSCFAIRRTLSMLKPSHSSLKLGGLFMRGWSCHSDLGIILAALQIFFFPPPIRTWFAKFDEPAFYLDAHQFGPYQASFLFYIFSTLDGGIFQH